MCKPTGERLTAYQLAVLKSQLKQLLDPLVTVGGTPVMSRSVE